MNTVLGSTIEFLIQYVWSGALETVFLINSQEMLMLLAPGPHFKNRSW